MKIDLILVKQISILSAFFGAIAGILTVIPYIGGISFTFELCFVAPLVIWLLLKYKCIVKDSINDGIIIGAISGFVSFLAFCALYVPISVILVKFFSYSASYGTAFIFKYSNLFLLTVVSVFMAVLSATINAFTGLLTYCILKWLK